VTSGRQDQASPSLSDLCGHTRHCSPTPDAVATSRRCWDAQGQDVVATTAVPRVAPASGTLEPVSRDYAGSNHDARPAAAPSPSLSTPCGRPCHCRATPRTTTTTPALLSTRGRDAATPATVPRTGHCQRPPRALSESLHHYASTLEAAPVRAQGAPRRCDWSKIRQDGHQLYDTVRHTATHVEIVRHAC
jgi:hypothetical protein